ncbi:hypothetical protein LTR66_017520, partial [Elasticomyces elasticus]
SWGRRGGGMQSRSGVSIPPRKRRRLNYDSGDVLPELEYPAALGLRAVDGEDDEEDDDEYEEEDDELDDDEAAEEEDEMVPSQITARGEFDDADVDEDEGSDDEQLDLTEEEQAELAVLNNEAEMLLAESKGILASTRSKRARSRSRSLRQESIPKQVSFIETTEVDEPLVNGTSDHDAAATTIETSITEAKTRGLVAVNERDKDEEETKMRTTQARRKIPRPVTVIQVPRIRVRKKVVVTTPPRSAVRPADLATAQAITPATYDHLAAAPQSMNPPGTGSIRTKMNNNRKKKKKLLSNLKAAGTLDAEADFDDLQRYLDGQAPKIEEANEEEIMQAAHVEAENDIHMKRQRLLEILDTSEVVEEHQPEPMKPRDIITAEPALEATTVTGDTPEQLVATSHVSTIDHDQKTNGSPIAPFPVDLSATAEQQQSRPEPSPRRAKLDLASSRRMLFNALGVRTPKTVEAEDALRQKLSTPSRQPKSKPELLVNALSPKALDPNRWKHKLVISAVECAVPDKKILIPPFPFKHPWQVRRERESEGCYDEDGTMLDYDEPIEHPLDTQGLEHADAQDRTPSQVLTNSRTITAGTNEDTEWVNPEQIAASDGLRITDVMSGAKIAYRQVHLTDNFQPEVSPYRIATVVSEHKGRIELELAPQSRTTRESQYNVEGERVYHGFEVGDDEYEDT